MKKGTGVDVNAAVKEAERPCGEKRAAKGAEELRFEEKRGTSRDIERRKDKHSNGKGATASQKKKGRKDEVLPCGLTQRQVNAMMQRELTPEDYEILSRLDEHVAKPASRLCTAVQVGRFPLMKIGKQILSGEEECGVCLCPMEEGEEARRLPCCARSCFHDDCITHWLTESKNTCPSCLFTFAREE